MNFSVPFSFLFLMGCLSAKFLGLEKLIFFGTLSKDRGKTDKLFLTPDTSLSCVLVSSHQCGVAGRCSVEGRWRLQDTGRAVSSSLG